jgi:hypothetical protein
MALALNFYTGVELNGEEVKRNGGIMIRDSNGF